MAGHKASHDPSRQATVRLGRPCAEPLQSPPKQLNHPKMRSAKFHGSNHTRTSLARFATPPEADRLIGNFHPQSKTPNPRRGDHKTSLADRTSS